MDIALWSGLPEELQELVFARLPWPHIYRVRILSKGWNEKLMNGTKDSLLRRACARAQPKSFGLLALGDDPGTFIVNMFDIASNKWETDKWETFETSLGYDPLCDEIQLVSASDGGLVCFLSKSQSKSQNIPRLVFVCNPLTGVWKQLPPLHGIVEQRIMVQLIMDRETKHYRVIVVGHCEGRRAGNPVKVYHSETGQWTEADGSSSGEVIYGYMYNFDSVEFEGAPCSYDFSDGRVLMISTGLEYAYESALLKDHLFRLYREVQPGRLQTHCIEESEACDGGFAWSPLRDYPFSRLPRNPQPIQPDKSEWFTFFLACKDFLLLNVFNKLGEGDYREVFFLYEFSAEEWRELPMTPEAEDTLIIQMQMCELRFDSVP